MDIFLFLYDLEGKDYIYKTIYIDGCIQIHNVSISNSLGLNLFLDENNILKITFFNCIIEKYWFKNSLPKLIYEYETIDCWLYDD